MNWRGTLGVDSLDLFAVFSSRRDGHFCCGFAGAMCGEAPGASGLRGDSDLDADRLRARE